MSWPFGELRPLSMDVIVADPPWDFENWSQAGTKKGADPHYCVMSLDEIERLPVGQLARGDCLLLLWATGCMLPQALSVMQAWGFRFVSEIVWHKVTRNGKTRMGTGYRVRTMHEPVLLGVMGSPTHRPFPSYFAGVARQHSRKPEEFYRLVDAHVPAIGKLDLFSRQSRPGWSAWGNEAGKFDQEAA